MKTSPTIAQLAEALSLAQGEMEAARKDSDNPFFHSKYADLASVWDACRGPLARHGLSVVQMPETNPDIAGVIITTRLMHLSGEFLESELRMNPKVDDPQGVGSAITYGRRYALAAAVGIAPEDDDANAASGKKPEAVTGKAITITKPKPASTAPAATPAPPSTAAPTPVPPEAVAPIPEVVEYIGRGEQVNFATLFRESLPKKFERDAEELRHEWLVTHKFIDADGNPSSKMIPKKDYVVFRQMAQKWAKEYTDAQ